LLVPGLLQEALPAGTLVVAIDPGEAVSEWLESDWPFASVEYAPRA